jgi:hypothetical protein
MKLGPEFRKATASGGGDCVYVALVNGEVHLKEASSAGATATTVVMPQASFRAFVDGVKAGEFEV